MGGGQKAPPRREDGQPSMTLWVGNVPPDCTEEELRMAFSPHGYIENVKIVAQKNCAFIRYDSLESAAVGHEAMHGQSIRNYVLRVGWGKPDVYGVTKQEPRETGPPPCRNLWLGNIGPLVQEDELRTSFEAFGKIEKIKLLPEKKCAFVNFMNMEEAMRARSAMQGRMLGGQPLKINYGKDTGPPSSHGGGGGGMNMGGGGGDRGNSGTGANMTPLQHNRFEAPPPPPENPEEQSIIDKFATYVAKHGVDFERVTYEKQSANPKFIFLVPGNPKYDYYKYKLNSLMRGSMGGSDMSFQPAPPQAEDLGQLEGLLDPLTNTGKVANKDSIRAAKNFIVSQTMNASAIAVMVKNRIERTPDFTQKLNVIYLINDVLHHSSHKRVKEGGPMDEFTLAFEPLLRAIFTNTYVNQAPDNQQKILDLLRLWGTRNIYSQITISNIESHIRTAHNSAPSSNPQSPSSTASERFLSSLGDLYPPPPPPSGGGNLQDNSGGNFRDKRGRSPGGNSEERGGSRFSNNRDDRWGDDRRDRGRDRDDDRDRRDRGGDRRDRDRDRRDRDRDDDRDDRYRDDDKESTRKRTRVSKWDNKGDTKDDKDENNGNDSENFANGKK